ncbi:recombinase family protein [Saccharothrix ecbatanensis]|uniref:recombinase family protein n=1 Tax=Saccharothrix ecbatanensis TaxID=1105145 RepID=UPI0035E45BE3
MAARSRRTGRPRHAGAPGAGQDVGCAVATRSGPRPAPRDGRHARPHRRRPLPGGRAPYGYRLVDAGLHPHPAGARRGRNVVRLEPDPETAPTVRWLFAQRLAGRSIETLVEILNQQHTPCPSAHDPDRNTHRTRRCWTTETVTTILRNPRYTRLAGLEPTVCRPRPPLPHRPATQTRRQVETGAPVDPVPTARPCRAGQRTRLRRGPTHPPARGDA